MKKMNFLLFCLAFSGCARLDPVSIIGSVWETKDTVKMIQNDVYTTRVATTTITFINATECTEDVSYSFGTGYVGSVLFSGLYTLEANRISMIFPYHEERGRFKGDELVVRDVSYKRK